MQIINNTDLPQGSQEWLDVRSKHGMASEAASALGVSKWDPKTPYALWKVKTGETVIETNFAMDHGNRWEDPARKSFEKEMDAKWEPVVVLNDIEGVPIGASLDGFNKDDHTILEIKCPLNGATSELWEIVFNDDQLPEQYWLQCQQQLLVTGSQTLYFWVFDTSSEQGLLRVVTPCKSTQERIIQGWQDYFKGDPEPAEVDVVNSTDADWLSKAKEWRAIQDELQVLKEMDSAMRKELIELSKGQSYIGGGVQLKHTTSKGRINYSKITELGDVDLELYRSPDVVKHYLKAI